MNRGCWSQRDQETLFPSRTDTFGRTWGRRRKPSRKGDIEEDRTWRSPYRKKMEKKIIQEGVEKTRRRWDLMGSKEENALDQQPNEDEDRGEEGI